MTSWDPQEIRSIEKGLETSTQPRLVMTDLGEAYAKFPGNPEGTQTLSCEVLGSLAASFLGLPTFEFAVLEVPEAELVSFRDGTFAPPGHVFMTKYQDGTTWGGDVDELKRASNPKDAAGFIVLDTWLQNCDRYREHGGTKPRENLGNVFLRFLESPQDSKKSFELVPIDHTHIITCGRDFSKKMANISKVRERALYGNFPGFQTLISNEMCHFFAGKLAEFGKEQAESWVGGLPRDWPPNEELRPVLCEYLVARARFVSENIVDILSEAGFIELELGEEGE